ncbi:hypothetical protein ACH5RR_006984 [Cinchona calisaya]|uniref:Uncharacterized protein n=1 Tax=Cinchona calisaya TaxID=153742 RepID=A0ABD3AQV3_9GENT
MFCFQKIGFLFHLSMFSVSYPQKYPMSVKSLLKISASYLFLSFGLFCLPSQIIQVLFYGYCSSGLGVSVLEFGGILLVARDIYEVNVSYFGYIYLSLYLMYFIQFKIGNKYSLMVFSHSYLIYCCIFFL